jgi:hypothetical protein
MTTGRGSVIVAKPGQQVIYLLGEAGIAAECRNGLIDAHGVCPERVRSWILGPVRPEHGHRLAVLGDRDGLAGLDAGQDLGCLLVQLTDGCFHDLIVLRVLHAGGLRISARCGVTPGHPGRWEVPPDPVTSRTVHSTFFESAGPDVFIATAATAGPWSPQAQHGGPPSALVARAMELHEPDELQRLARVTVDILQPVPVGEITVRTRMVRPGRRVSLLETVLEAGGREVLHARGWRIALPGGPVPVLPDLALASAPPPVPGGQDLPQFPSGHTTGYLSAMEWRFVSGGFGKYRPGSAWARPRIPLLPGEEISPMCGALLAADSGSGIAMVLDPAHYLCINVDLSVVLPRDPAGDWLLLESAVTIGEQGTGLAETALSDTSGRCGTGLQTLVAQPR